MKLFLTTGIVALGLTGGLADTTLASFSTFGFFGMSALLGVSLILLPHIAGPQALKAFSRHKSS